MFWGKSQDKTPHPFHTQTIDIRITLNDIHTTTTAHYRLWSYHQYQSIHEDIRTL